MASNESAPPAVLREDLLSSCLRLLAPEEVEQWTVSQGRRLTLQLQDHAIAAALERAGHSTRRDRHGDQFVIGTVSGVVAKAPAWRHINMIPSVAHYERQKLLLSVRWFDKWYSNGHALRYGVITSGERIPLSAGAPALRFRIQHLSRLTSRWASECREWGIEVLLRANEVTLNDQEDPEWHPHTNILYRPTRFLTHAEWSAWLKWSHAFLGVVWKDCGIVEDLAEVLKYIVKPADLIVSHRSNEAIACLFEASVGLHMVKNMGALRDMVSKFRRRRLMVKSVIRRNGKRSLCLVQGVKEKDDDQDPPPSDPEAKRENMIVSKPSLPSPALLPMAEPVVMVLGYTENPTTPGGVRGLARLRAIQAEMRAAWEAHVGPLADALSEAFSAISTPPTLLRPVAA